MTYLPNPALDKATNAQRVSEINKHLKESQTLDEITDGTDGTYNYYIDMEEMDRFAVQLILDGGSGTVTVKIYATVQDDGTAADSCSYEDFTYILSGVSSFTADAIIVDNASVCSSVKYVKVEVVASTGGSNDADWTIYKISVD